MRSKRKKYRRPRSNAEVLLPPIEVDTVAMIKELNDSFLSGSSPMSPENRRAYERALHDQVGKTILHLSAISMHKQQRHHKLLSIADFILNYITDPEYLIPLLKHNPDTAFKILAMVHKMESDDSNFQYELATGKKNKEDDGFDAKKALNLVVGLVGASQSNLPGSLKSPRKLREFRSMAQTLIDLMHGKQTPSPPSTMDRIIRTEDIQDDD